MSDIYDYFSFLKCLTVMKKSLV